MVKIEPLRKTPKYFHNVKDVKVSIIRKLTYDVSNVQESILLVTAIKADIQPRNV